MPESTYDDDSTICPYCDHPHHQEAEDFNDREHEEVCEECGETFLAYDEATVTHYARKKPNASGQAVANPAPQSHDR